MRKHVSKRSRRRSRKRRLIKAVLFCAFLAVFAVSASMLLKNYAEYKKAENSYSELQALRRQEEYTASTAVKKDKAIVPVVTETESMAEFESEGSTAEQKKEADESKQPSVEQNTGADISKAPADWETESSDENGVENSTAEPTKEADESKQPPIQQRISMNFSTLKEINPEIIGWIQAEGTNIDYPIAQTDNNEYYLNHLYNGNTNSSGTIFADYRNAGDFSDRNTVVYGHHMKNGTMFQSLEEYKDQEFYDANPTMTLFSPYGDYIIELVSGTVEDGNHQFIQMNFESEEAFSEYMDAFRARSTFISDVEIQPGDRIVSLCTCSYEWENARYIVIGRLVPVMETVD